MREGGREGRREENDGATTTSRHTYIIKCSYNYFFLHF